MIHELLIRTKGKTQVLDITDQIAAIVGKQGGEGVCCVYVQHATAAVVINENADPNIGLDLLDALAALVPEGKWRHDRIDDNAAAHIKAAILGPGETIPYRDGRLLLGRWQSVMLVELDGPRERRVLVRAS